MLLLSLGALIWASGLLAAAAVVNISTARAPRVTIHPPKSKRKNVTITGVSFPTFKQDVYLGIPYAQPPVGDLRFRPPQPKTFTTSSFNATAQPPGCIQINSTFIGSYGISEDCLYLNVFTPEGWGPQSPPLPVMVWVYGGSFQVGTITTYNATSLMARGIETGKPSIFVATNYRLNVLGFGYGAEIALNHAANLGLRDLHLGFQWIQDNIHAFGGDPNKVTAFGQSAGAVAISLMYLNTSSHAPLFRSAIMESGAQSVVPIGPTNTTWQIGYDLLAKFSGCAARAATSLRKKDKRIANYVGSAAYNQSTFLCLKALPADELLDALVKVSNVTGPAGLIFGFKRLGPSIDGDLITDSPHTLLQKGEFVKLPFITGSCLDEGTDAAPVTQVKNENQVKSFISSFEPSPIEPAVIDGLLKLYPDVPALGSPYNTGNQTFGFASEFKQLAAMFGDLLLQAGRRWFLQQARAHGQRDTWTYLWTEPSVGFEPYTGVAHGSELYYVFGLARNFTGYDAAQVALVQRVQDYWINFAYYSDPNGPPGSTSSLKYWPTYGENSTMLQFGRNDSLIFDTYRKKQFDYILSHPEAFNY
ncbi:hypothetical protein TREMEDRAFT_60040 [Tremella mesenterica DSM 1558]|uniref:uncharacterized protein n=1 Tax=Tremella mesenterica (strain ATCC 24925 / CBS 8224 / DSM 1558 / NBRC 9311 / NRRL Y-6157 / RJB 2259-6 / UBC 559-6) TaxID=578456 RepID=UPI0003F497F3|nr:uncharacterized protein TREMEDRAFT_60040 [Tremella mesenterica DSM 1558]EIW71100.1 hypothetical protein TREMEDRAFT_60040 [Tremella mesenterica DSM 1558]